MTSTLAILGLRQESGRKGRGAYQYISMVFLEGTYSDCHRQREQGCRQQTLLAKILRGV
jgi:hypothetical protein